MPPGRKHLEKAEKASREAEDMAACDPGMQEWRELMRLEEGPEGTVYLTPLPVQHAAQGRCPWGHCF